MEETPDEGAGACKRARLADVADVAEAELRDQIECICCKEIMLEPHIMCANDHSACTACIKRILECPTCKGALISTPVRNRTLIRWAELSAFKFDCSTCHAAQVPYAVLRSAHTTCGNPRGKCKLFGCDDIIDLTAIRQHLVARHHAFTHTGNEHTFLVHLNDAEPTIPRVVVSPTNLCTALQLSKTHIRILRCTLSSRDLKPTEITFSDISGYSLRLYTPVLPFTQLEPDSCSFTLEVDVLRRVWGIPSISKLTVSLTA